MHTGCVDGKWKNSTGAISSSLSTRKKGAVNPQLLQDFELGVGDVTGHAGMQTLKGLQRLWQKWKLTIAPNPQKKTVNTTRPLTLGKSIPIFIKQCAQVCGLYVCVPCVQCTKWITTQNSSSIPRKIHGVHPSTVFARSPSAKYVSFTNWDGDTINLQKCGDKMIPWLYHCFTFVQVVMHI